MSKGKQRKGNNRTAPRVTRCPRSDKSGYRNWSIATKAASRVPVPCRIYWCPYCGMYHLTSRSEAEYQQVVAETGARSWRKPGSRRRKPS